MYALGGMNTTVDYYPARVEDDPDPYANAISSLREDDAILSLYYGYPAILEARREVLREERRKLLERAGRAASAAALPQVVDHAA